MSPQQVNQGTIAGAETNERLAKRSKTREILDMQRVLRGEVEKDGTKPLERAACARAWDTLEERLRILRGKPLPGQLQPAKEPKRRPGRRVIGIASPEQIAAQVASESAA